MTFIAIHAQHDRATIVTDTWATSDSARYLAHVPKLTHVPGRFTCLTRGSAQFATMIDGLAHFARPATLSSLLRDAARQLDTAWEADPRPRQSTAVFVVQYSEARGRYTITGYDEREDFASRDLGEYFVIPSDWRSRPSQMELRELGTIMDPTDPGDAADLEALAALPAASPPPDDDGWARLVARTRNVRSRGVQRAKIYIGGAITLTDVRPGRVPDSRIIGWLPEDVATLVDIFAGSLHPLGQVSPCACGSGRRALDCHLADLEQPCWCGSGLALANCCRLTDAQAEQATAALRSTT